MIAYRLRLVRKIVRIDADAVAADEARPERQKIPLGAGCSEHGFSVDAHSVEDNCQFIDESNVEVALGVLDNLGGLCNFDAGCLMRPGDDDLLVELVNEIGGFRRGARSDLLDIPDPMLFIAGVNALGTIPGIEVQVELKPRDLLQYWDAVVLGSTGIDG